MSAETQTTLSQQAAPAAKGELLARTLAKAFVDDQAHSSATDDEQCDHKFVRDQEAINHHCCQLCGKVCTDSAKGGGAVGGAA